jgi:hypothetical protein
LSASRFEILLKPMGLVVAAKGCELLADQGADDIGARLD